MTRTVTPPQTSAAVAQARIQLDSHGVARWELTRKGRCLAWGYAPGQAHAHREVLAAAQFERISGARVDIDFTHGSTPATQNVTVCHTPALRAALLTLVEATSVALVLRRELRKDTSVLANADTAPDILCAAIEALEAVEAAGAALDAAGARAERGTLNADALTNQTRLARYLRATVAAIEHATTTALRDARTRAEVAGAVQMLCDEADHARSLADHAHT